MVAILDLRVLFAGNPSIFLVKPVTLPFFWTYGSGLNFGEFFLFESFWALGLVPFFFLFYLSVVCSYGCSSGVQAQYADPSVS